MLNSKVRGCSQTGRAVTTAAPGQCQCREHRQEQPNAELGFTFRAKEFATESSMHGPQVCLDLSDNLTILTAEACPLPQRWGHFVA